MGGQNHHMCTGCIRHTTLLSKTYSLAESEMLLANAVLEDTMVAELYDSFDHARHFAAQITRYLDSSLRYLEETKAMAEEVIQLMEVTPYQNGEALRALDFDRFREALERNGIDVSHESAWTEVVERFRKDGVRGSFTMFIEHLNELSELTKDVNAAISEARARSSRSRKMVDMFEENEESFKIRFARLITKYRVRGLMFSYAALVTTEAHLVSNNYRSVQIAA